MSDDALFGCPYVCLEDAPSPEVDLKFYRRSTNVLLFPKTAAHILRVERRYTSHITPDTTTSDSNNDSGRLLTILPFLYLFTF